MLEIEEGGQEVSRLLVHSLGLSCPVYKMGMITMHNVAVIVQQYMLLSHFLTWFIKYPFIRLLHGYGSGRHRGTRGGKGPHEIRDTWVQAGVYL